MANPTTNLALPEIVATVGAKHVTHNEALRTLDAIVQASVISAALATPPGSPADGDQYIVASGATDAWTGQDGKFSAYQDGAWRFRAPKTGWRAYIVTKESVFVYNGSAWVPITSEPFLSNNLGIT